MLSTFFCTRYLVHAEKQALELYSSKIHDDLRHGQFDVLRLIKAADSSQSSCFIWQALELLRSLLKKDQEQSQHPQSFIVSRATVQRSQCYLEAASENLVSVTRKDGNLFLLCIY